MNTSIDLQQRLFITLMLCFAFCLGHCQYSVEAVYKIKADKVALRQKPTRNSKRIAILNKGEAVTINNGHNYIEDEVNGAYGVWLRTSANGKSGYVFQSYVSSTRIYPRKDSAYFYVVDTSKNSIALSDFDRPNWYTVESGKVTSINPPSVVWDDTSKVIHYDNHKNMVATNLYLPSDVDLSYLFDYNKSAVVDTVYADYNYKRIGSDSLTIRLNGGDKWNPLDLNSGHEPYLFVEIQSLVDVNGDGILDVLYTLSSNYEQSYFFFLSKNGMPEYESLPITFKEFPYGGC